MTREACAPHAQLGTQVHSKWRFGRETVEKSSFRPVFLMDFTCFSLDFHIFSLETLPKDGRSRSTAAADPATALEPESFEESPKDGGRRAHGRPRGRPKGG